MRRTFQLEGRVVDEEQRPVAGALVRLKPGDRSHTTNADGAFAFDRVAFGRYSVSAHKDDFYARPELVGREDSGDPIILRLQLGATLIVHAFADRAPVVGAKLVLDEASTTTDANGTATIRGLAPGFRHGWLVAPGWADEYFLIVSNEDPGGVLERFITLQHCAARIEGVVIGPLGRPIPRATVRLWDSNGYRLRTTSDAEGKWHLYACAGTYRVVAHSRIFGPITEPTIKCDGRTPQRDVVVRVGFASVRHAVAALVRAGKRLLGGGKGARVAGVVLDDTGQPADEACIRISCGRQANGPDSRGRFEFDGLESGEYVVTASWPHSETKPEGQRVRSGDTNVRLVLAAGGTITGRVLLDGEPLPYYGLSLTREKVHGGRPIGIRAEDGRFTLRNVDPGRWRIGLLGPGTRLKVFDEIAIERGQQVELGDVAMERGRRVAGHVRDRSGALVAGARVIIGYRFLGDDRSRLQQWFMSRYETTTDAHGRYVFDGIDAALPMMSQPHTWATHFNAGASVTRELPQTEATVDFVLLGAGRIEGIVQGMRGGHSIARAVRADEPPAARMSPVDKEGTFQFEDVPPGDYFVSLQVPESEQVSSANVTVVANQTATAKLAMVSSSVQLTLRTPPGRSMNLLFEPPLSEPAGGRIVRSMSMGTEDRCLFDYVQPGTYRVSLDGKAWTSIVVNPSPAEQTIDLRDGA